MTFEELTNSLPLITGGLFGISIFFIFLAVVYFRRGRRAPYWTQRRTAGEQGLRIMMIGVFFLTITAISCGLTLIYNYIEPDATVEDNNTAVAGFETQPAQPVTVFPTTENTGVPQVSPTLTEITDEPSVEATVEPSATEEPTATLEITATIEPTTPIVEESVEATIEENSAETNVASPVANTDQLPTETLTVEIISLTPTPTATATATETPTPTATATATDLPTETLTLTPSFTPTATATLPPTETLVPSDTPMPQATAIVETTNLQPFRTPSSLADLDILVVASGVSTRQQPLNSGLSFGSDLTRLYYFVKFENMVGGSLWQVKLYRAGTLVYHRTALWGNTINGEIYFFIGLPDGFVTGDYELQLTIGEQPNPITTTNFTVTE